MAADILFTPLGDIVKTAALYGGLGVVILVFHWRARGIIRDLLFFLTFAVTVTSSVRLAGVLIVFSLLVAPALVALTIGRGVLLVNAWIVGTVVNVVAIYASYKFDLPTGYTIVFFQAFTALAVCALPLQGGKRNHAVTSSHQGA
jgi:zinc/manganese transport system permease protein